MAHLHAVTARQWRRTVRIADKSAFGFGDRPEQLPQSYEIRKNIERWSFSFTSFSEGALAFALPSVVLPGLPPPLTPQARDAADQNPHQRPFAGSAAKPIWSRDALPSGSSLTSPVALPMVSLIGARDPILIHEPTVSLR
jgi:hypothetical protein